MILIKLAQKFSSYCEECETVHCIYEKITTGKMKDFILPFGPLKVIKIAFYIEQILKGNNPQSITNDLDSNLYIFTTVDFSSENEISVDCSSCEGVGYENCDDCQGVGETSCSECGGTGETDDDEICNTCNGEGNETCQLCLGGKLFTCEKCNGKGYVDVSGTEFEINYWVTFDENIISKIGAIQEFLKLGSLYRNSKVAYIGSEMINYEKQPYLVTRIEPKFAGKIYIVGGEPLRYNYLFYNQRNEIIVDTPELNYDVFEIIEGNFT